METFGFLLFYICFAYLLYRKIKSYGADSQEDEPEEQPREFDSMRLQKEVQYLHDRMQELEQLDNMIIDLRLCRPSEAIKAFRVEWCSASGAERGIQLMADGQNTSSQHLLALAESQREEKNREIIQRIYDLYTICCERDYQEVSGPPIHGEITD